ncbi:MAG: hypothetical protein ACREHG_10230 [Candidatus Saccharimonadales bacterium]
MVTNRLGDSPSPEIEVIPRFTGPNPSVDRAPLNRNDTTEVKDLQPWFHDSYYIPPAQSQPSWTAAGPARHEMHISTFRLRQMAGKYGQNQEGMHTNIPRPVRSGRIQMQAGRQRNFLTVQRYRGQSYSETTTTI